MNALKAVPPAMVGVKLGSLVAGGPKDMKPDFSYLPFTSTITSIVQGMMGLGIIIAVGALIVGAILYAAGKASGAQGMSHASVGGMVVAVIVGAVIASAGALIGWAMGLPLVPGA